MKKVTKATLKSFIKKNEGKLFIRSKSSFDGMVDGCTNESDRGFKSASKANEYGKYNLGYKGLWLVGSSGNYFNSYEDDKFVGIEVYNCCGNSIVAIEKAA